MRHPTSKKFRYASHTSSKRELGNLVSYKGMSGWSATSRTSVTVYELTMTAALRTVVFAVILVAAAKCEDGGSSPPETATNVFANVFDECLQHWSLSCVRPKVLRYLRSALKRDEIALTEDLSIVRNDPGLANRDFKSIQLPEEETEKEKTLRYILLERIDNFLNSHHLKVKIPREITSGELLPLVPEFLQVNIPNELSVPLTDTKNAVQERGFMKKVMIPFLLGLKFKATLFIPLAIALIALKTWKALTLGLLSLVLSAAMVIFKFTKPKVVNYEVYHYPSHHSAPMVEHPPPYGDHHGGYGRSDGQILAYRGHLN